MAALLLGLLAACAGLPPATPPGGADAQRDGPPANPPSGLIDLPDAEPRVEPIRSGGPNKPYEVLGQRYTPLTSDEPMAEAGLASWYGRKFHGRPTASGEAYDMYAMSAAHRTMPLPSYARVRNPSNGREVVVRINDRGPFHSTRIIDLSYAAALKLDVLHGVTPVEVQRLTHEDIRSGSWRGGATPALAVAPVAPTAPAAQPEPQPVANSEPMAEPAAAITPPTAAAKPVAERGVQAAKGFWLQLGAFRQPQGAFELRQQLMRELAWLEPWLTVFEDDAMFRLQAGPYASRSEALGAAQRLRGSAAPLPMVLQRR